MKILALLSGSTQTYHILLKICGKLKGSSKRQTLPTLLINFQKLKSMKYI